jgi:ribosomal-protein-alanine N-acetyltransferase
MASQVAFPTIRPLVTAEERDWCAQLMASSEPWITLGRTLEASRRLFEDPSRDVLLATLDDAPVGFAVFTLIGPFSGYIQSLAVIPTARSAGIGSALMRHAEARIFEASPNVFLCVSSFNDRARDFYERAGYELIGELRDYFVRGHSELLFRKSRGPWNDFDANARSSEDDGQIIPAN